VGRAETQKAYGCSGPQRDIRPQLALTVLDIRQQITQKHPHPGGLLGVLAGIESKHRDASGDLLQRQQSTLKNLSGKGRGLERRHGRKVFALSVPTGIHPRLCENRITGKT